MCMTRFRRRSMKTWPICLPGPFKGCINRLFGDFQGCQKKKGLEGSGVFMWLSTVRFDSVAHRPDSASTPETRGTAPIRPLRLRGRSPRSWRSVFCGESPVDMIYDLPCSSRQQAKFGRTCCVVGRSWYVRSWREPLCRGLEVP